MQVSVETTEGLGRRLTVALPSEEIESAVAERLRSLGRTARLNGFRPGKVPFKVVQRRFGPQVRDEVLGTMINRSFRDAVQQEKLRPAGQPLIEEAAPAEGEGEGEDGFRFTATFEVYPEFEPVYDAEIKVARPVVDIEDEDVERMLGNLRSQRTEHVAVERAARKGDQLLIDFSGRVDGEPFDGGSAEGVPLVLGSGSMIDGFEEQLEGASAGEQRTVRVRFPNEYRAEHLAGREAEFEVRVHEVREAREPQMDAAFVRSFGIEDGELESLKADVRRNMERELRQRIDARVKEQVMQGLLERNPIVVPEALVAEEIGRQREQLARQMAPGADLSQLGDELFRDRAERRVRVGLVLGEIIQRRELRADASAVREQIERVASAYQDPQEVIDHYYGNPELLRGIEGLVLEDAVVQAVLEAATVSDEPTSFEAIMNPETQTAADGGGQEGAADAAASAASGDDGEGSEER